MTLDKFLNQGNKQTKKSEITTVIPIQLMSVKKLIYAFENDSESNLQKTFKKHYYVGFLQPD